MNIDIPLPCKTSLFAPSKMIFFKSIRKKYLQLKVAIVPNRVCRCCGAGFVCASFLSLPFVFMYLPLPLPLVLYVYIYTWFFLVLFFLKTVLPYRTKCALTTLKNIMNFYRHILCVFCSWNSLSFLSRKCKTMCTEVWGVIMSCFVHTGCPKSPDTIENSQTQIWNRVSWSITANVCSFGCH